MRKTLIMNYKNQKAILSTLIILSVVLTLVLGCTEGKKEEKIESLPVVKTEPKILGCQVLNKLPDTISMPLDTNYGNKIKLLGITTNKKPSSNQLEIAYFWQVLQELGSYRTVFIHFTDQERNLLFQNDHDFCPDYSFQEKSRDRFIKESFLIYIPESVTNTKVDIKIGIYDSISGSRLTIEPKKGILTDYENTAFHVKNII